MSEQKRIDISKYNKAELLAALYNNSRPLGMGFLHYEAQDMTKQEATDFLSNGTRFDYLKGRVMKVELGGDTFEPWLYDRDNGEGAAQRVIDSLNQ